MNTAVPAVLPSSRDDLKGKLALLASIPAVERVQIDVVDGKFASPASWPYTAPEEMRDMVAQSEMLPHLERIAYEIDLMCVDADQAAGDWLALGATRLTFHAESVSDLPRHLEYVRTRYGGGADFASELIQFGVALNVASDFALIESSLHEVSYVQLMGIAKIGRQGEPLDERIYEKVRIFHSKHPEIPIQIDGGVTLEKAKKLLALGVDSLIEGSSIVRAPNPSVAFTAFENLKNSYGV
jgi:ribulose-phosphate 3-epimerase